MGNRCHSTKKQPKQVVNKKPEPLPRDDTTLSRKASVASEGERISLPKPGKGSRSGAKHDSSSLETTKPPSRIIKTANSVQLEMSNGSPQNNFERSSPQNTQELTKIPSMENSKRIAKSLSVSITMEHYKNMTFLNHTLVEFHQMMKLGNMDGFELLYQDKKNDHKLKIYMKSYITEERNRVNIFRSDFYVPCSAEFFVKFQNNVEEQTKLDDLLQEFYAIESPAENINLLYLSYKKTMVSSPRDFVYLKYFKPVQDEQGKVWIDVSKSVLDERYPPKKNYIRAETICSGHYVQNVKERANYCFVRSRSEVDFKVNVPLFLVKSFSVGELRKYFERSIKRIVELQN